MLREYRATRETGRSGCRAVRRRQGDRWHLSVSPTLVLARLGNATASLLLRSQARRKAYRARSAETKGTAQLPLRGQVRRKEKGRPYNDANAVMTERILRHEYTILAW